MAETPLTLTFRCPRELEGLIPPPVPAAQGLPDWLRAMPQQAFSRLIGGEDDTVKRCPPFLDAMTCGFLIPLFCDLVVKAGEFTWDADLPPGKAGFPRAPIGFHDPAQVSGAPLADPGSFILKFHNLWTIEAPRDYALLITHPLNRLDLPFTTLTGLVDCDRYVDAFIHFPAVWRDEAFEGVVPKGTPIAQCIPVRREAWAVRTAVLTDEKTQAAHDLMLEIGREKGVYRRRFRA
ncbi:MAG TPA: hypothetical protein VGH15_10335 [Caulobacteraceae bacterium]|jgi:hypothetical protein